MYHKQDGLSKVPECHRGSMASCKAGYRSPAFGVVYEGPPALTGVTTLVLIGDWLRDELDPRQTTGS